MSLFSSTWLKNGEKPIPEQGKEAGISWAVQAEPLRASFGSNKNTTSRKPHPTTQQFLFWQLHLPEEFALTAWAVILGEVRMWMMEIRVLEGNEVKWIPCSSLCVPHVGTPKLHHAEALKHPALPCPALLRTPHVQASFQQAAVSCCEQQPEGAGSALPLHSQEPPPAALHLHPQGHGAAAVAQGGSEESHKDAPGALE